MARALERIATAVDIDVVDPPLEPGGDLTPPIGRFRPVGPTQIGPRQPSRGQIREVGVPIRHGDVVPLREVRNGRVENLRLFEEGPARVIRIR